MDSAVLKCSEGLVQLRQCPQCGYLVKEVDVVWKRQPTDMTDKGEVEGCVWCIRPTGK